MTQVKTIDPAADRLTRLAELKQSTRSDHQSVDDMVMEMAPFANRENYARFLRLQYIFHSAMYPLYLADDLNQLMPGLADRSRQDAVLMDLADLGCDVPDHRSRHALPQTGAARIGWLYVCEGSSLGAAFLLKAAAGIGLSADFGASHLAAHSDGRGRHWREFVDQVNGLALGAKEDEALREGACAAFEFFRNLLIADAANMAKLESQG
ncbi:MAG: biliverdin-producing heme oxygenase [Rhodospirillales bacterium]|nr:biliverdin-producing heme oxygenase [Rhodospirillales bacterium]